MSATPEFLDDSIQTKEAIQQPLPIIIIGNGPVGMRAAKQILENIPASPLIIYGDEQQEPYNRIQLSSWLAGDVDWNSLLQPLTLPENANIEQRFGYKITKIDPTNHTIEDNNGKQESYSKLILATGSNPYEPNIPGIDQHGVYTFRNFKDANSLIARRARTHHTIILGGGLLGIESARAMQKNNTKVTLIEHADRLLSNQLDSDASEILKQDITKLGIKLIISDSVTEILGKDRVEGLTLRSGEKIDCDTIILSTGIRPNIELAKQAKLAYNRGIIVNDSMQTSNPDIYAIGECAEHREKVYGLVAPGLEQASVAVAHLNNIDNAYSGSVAASRLKVIGTQVFSMGPMGNDAIQHYGNSYVYKNQQEGIYRKILVHRYRLVGAIGLGQWDESVRLQTTIGNSARIFPWQVLRFLKTGNIWPEEIGQNIATWPASAVVCQCMNVTRGSISECITNKSSCSAKDISQITGASTVCGSCKPLVQDLLGNSQPLEPAPLYQPLAIFSGISLLAAILFFISPSIPYADSVQHQWHWDQLWRNQLFKQISGFSILGLFSIGLLLSLRKRFRRFDKWGSFDIWRMIHIALGTTVIAVLIAHTGFRMGNGLNFLLMLSFCLMLIVGSLSSSVIAFEHKIGSAVSTRLRRLSIFGHILLFWPIPVLLAWHILKGYWY